MLKSLHIKNFAIISDVRLQLREGLNVMSGETGAGKSIIVQALILLLGGRGYSDLIRKGEKEAEVVGEFQNGSETFELRRLLSSDGKNKISVNGKPSTIANLQSICSDFIDLATQHENQSLLQPEQHREILDLFGQIETFKEEYSSVFDRCMGVDKKRKDFLRKVKNAQQEEDFLKFQLQEIKQAALVVGEEEELIQERELSKNSVRVGESMARIDEALSGANNPVSQVSTAAQELSRLAQLDPKLASHQGNLETALSLIQETTEDLKNYKHAYDPDRLQQIEDRLDLIKRMKKKFHCEVDEIVQKKKKLTEDLNRLENHDEILEELKKEQSVANEDLQKSAAGLTKKRKDLARQLSSDVEKELRTLGMPKIQFVASVEPLASGDLHVKEDCFNKDGGDSVEFLMAPNPGEGIRPMVRIASGGELARILLAMKSVLGKTRNVKTYIFDEVDVGVGGAAAEAVGKSLQRLSKGAQVITITHLPQIASLADLHLAIRKTVKLGRTSTTISPLEPGERVDEISRMLGGMRITDKVRAHAKELLKTV